MQGAPSRQAIPTQIGRPAQAWRAARTISGVEVVARCDPALHPRPGDQLTAVVDTAHLHLVDPMSGASSAADGGADPHGGDRPAILEP